MASTRVLARDRVNEFIISFECAKGAYHWEFKLAKTLAYVAHDVFYVFKNSSIRKYDREFVFSIVDDSRLMRRKILNLFFKYIQG